MSIDTTADAASNPDSSQPWAELGLKADEYERIKEILQYDKATVGLHTAALRGAAALYGKLLPAIDLIKPEKLSAGDVAKLATSASRMADVAMSALGEHYGIQDYLAFIEKAGAARDEAPRGELAERDAEQEVEA